MTTQTPGQTPYEAYRHAVGALWRTDGSPSMPEFAALPADLRRAWEAVEAATQPVTDIPSQRDVVE